MNTMNICSFLYLLLLQKNVDISYHRSNISLTHYTFLVCMINVKKYIYIHIAVDNLASKKFINQLEKNKFQFRNYIRAIV